MAVSDGLVLQTHRKHDFNIWQVKQRVMVDNDTREQWMPIALYICILCYAWP